MQQRERDMKDKIDITGPIIKIILSTLGLIALILTPGFLFHFCFKGETLGTALLFSVIYTFMMFQCLCIFAGFSSLKTKKGSATK